MIKSFVAVVLVSLTLVTQAMAGPILGTERAERLPNRYVVVLKQGQHLPSVANEMAFKHQGRVSHVYGHALNGFAVEMPEGRLKALANDPRVEYVEADFTISLDATQNSPTWGLDRVDQRDLPLSGSYTYETTAANVSVYVIDTGIRLTHAEFGARALNGFTAIGDGNGTDDCHGHGTHVAGTVGGETYGIAKEATLYAVRVLDCTGSGTLSGVIAGIDWVTANRIRPAVANMSLGGGASSSLDTAVRNSIAAGVTYAVAAGNENTDACTRSPARVAEALTTGATTVSDARASFSNWGTCVDVFAPGQSITSAWIGSDVATSSISGTSMASPHVAGIAALYLAGNPSAEPAQVLDAVVTTATAGRLSNVGSGSPNLLAYSLLAMEDGGDTGGGAACPTGSETYTGNLAATGDIEYQPNGTYYYSGSGAHSGSLSGPATADFDLYLWKWSRTRGWVVVGSSTSAGSTEAIDYSGSAGYYLWSIQSYSGSGDYAFCLNRP